MSLEDLFEELRDMEVSDPVCMDKILIYLDEIEKDADEYMQLLVEKMSHAKVTWEQPWYQRTTKLTEKIENCEGQPQFREDLFTQEECDHIKHRWSKLVKKYNIPDKIECYAKWRNRGFSKKASVVESVRGFINSYLARGLERTISRVYRHVLNKYANTKKGHYSEDEEKVMEICFFHNFQKAVLISSTVLDRTARGILYRFDGSVKGNPEKHRIKWNLSLATKFLKILMECTGETLQGLKNKYIEKDVWCEVQKQFGSQPYYYLRHFWYSSLHCQLFIKHDVTLRRVRKNVFKILRHSPYKLWTDIKWKEVAAKLPEGFTFQFIYRVTIRIFRKKRQHTRLPLKDIVDIGLKNTRRKGYGNKRLKTVILNEKGELEYCRYDTKF